MKRRAYIVMTAGSNVVGYRQPPKPVAVFDAAKDARAFTIMKAEKANRNIYWYTSAERPEAAEMTTADISRIVALIEKWRKEADVNPVAPHDPFGRWNEATARCANELGAILGDLCPDGGSIAQQPSNAVQDGYVLVPKSLTLKMRGAGVMALTEAEAIGMRTGDALQAAYTAMLAAAQEPPK